MLKELTKDEHYILDADEYFEMNEQVDEWDMYSKIDENEDDMTYTAREIPYGLEGEIKINKYATGRPGLPNRRRLSWRMLKLKRMIIPTRRFSGNSCNLRKVYDHVEREQKIYWLLNENPTGRKNRIKYIPPSLFDYGFYDGRAYSVTQRLGKPISLLSLPNGNVKKVAVDILYALEQLHSIGYVHQHLNLEAIVHDYYNPQEVIYLVHFENAQKFKNWFHYPFIDAVQSFVGDCAFASLAAHNKKRQTRKDDLISCVFILIFLTKKELPWEQDAEKNDWEKTKQMKTQMLRNYKQTKSDLPEEIVLLLDHVLNLSRFEKPNYEHLRSLFHHKDQPSKDDVGTEAQTKNTLAALELEIPIKTIQPQPEVTCGQTAAISVTTSNTSKGEPQGETTDNVLLVQGVQHNVHVILQIYDGFYAMRMHGPYYMHNFF